MCLTVPFLGFYDPAKMRKLRFPLSCLLKIRGDKVLTPEQNTPDEEIPPHLYHWRWDFDNPCQRKFLPIHSILEMMKEVDVHTHQLTLGD